MRAFVESTLSDLSHEVSEMSEAKKKIKIFLVLMMSEKIFKM